MSFSQDLFGSSAVAAGILSFFSPCIIPLLPVYLGILTDQTQPEQIQAFRRKNLIKTFLFVLGFATSFIILGFGAGELGALLNHRLFTLIGGVLMIMMGISQLGLFHFQIFSNGGGLNLNTQTGNRYWNAYVLGLVLSFGWTPCIGPMLASILVLAASEGAALRGAFLMTLYTLGLSLPFFLIVLFSDVLLQKIKAIQKYMPLIRKAGGILIILIGFLLLFNRLMF